MDQNNEESRRIEERARRIEEARESNGYQSPRRVEKGNLLRRMESLREKKLKEEQLAREKEKKQERERQFDEKVTAEVEERNFDMLLVMAQAKLQSLSPVQLSKAFVLVADKANVILSPANREKMIALLQFITKVAIGKSKDAPISESFISTVISKDPTGESIAELIASNSGDIEQLSGKLGEIDAKNGTSYLRSLFDRINELRGVIEDVGMER